MLARGIGMSLGKLWMVHIVPNSIRPEGHVRMMARQRHMSILDDTSYNLDENAMVSDDPRSAAFNVNVNASYYLV